MTRLFSHINSRSHAIESQSRFNFVDFLSLCHSILRILALRLGIQLESRHPGVHGGEIRVNNAKLITYPHRVALPTK
jgi:hypothetical protein